VISPVTVGVADPSLLLHIVDLAAGRHFSIAADDAAASESREAEKPNETHRVLPAGRSSKLCTVELSLGIWNIRLKFEETSRLHARKILFIGDFFD
jgi:hypothetical protein